MGAKKKPEEEKVGGIWFYLSLLFILISILIFLPNWVLLVFHDSSFSRWRQFIGAFFFGIGFTVVVIRGGLNTAIHELKHKALSGMIGNRAKKVAIEGGEGSFEYEYTETTAKYNAFISLAPYFLPLFSILTFPFWGFRFGWGDAVRIMILGAAYGIDIMTAIRDIGPHQTDFSGIRGGYRVGLFYVVTINILVWMFISAWIVGDFHAIGKLLQDTVYQFFMLTLKVKGTVTNGI